MEHPFDVLESSNQKKVLRGIKIEDLCKQNSISSYDMDFFIFTSTKGVHFTMKGSISFKRLIPVILTDNGSEFSNPKAIEYGAEIFTGHRTNVFYCDAGNPYQKGAIEVNHELIRRILPKGTSLTT